jgi:predicted outer membrane protein
MTDNAEKKMFDLKDILNISPEMLQSLQSLTLNNNENNSMNSSSILSQINTLSNTSSNTLSNKEDLKKKLRDKRNALKNNRLGKKYQEDNQIKTLKENPLFQNMNGGNLNGANDADIKNTIESMASKMSNDPKQKKNIKKQMNHLIEKMKESS